MRGGRSNLAVAREALSLGECAARPYRRASPRRGRDSHCVGRGGRSSSRHKGRRSVRPPQRGAGAPIALAHCWVYSARICHSLYKLVGTRAMRVALLAATVLIYLCSTRAGWSESEFIVTRPFHYAASSTSWVQLHFSAYNLGSRSRIDIQSDLDKHVEVFDQTTLSRNEGWSAAFNGTSVTVWWRVHKTEAYLLATPPRAEIYSARNRSPSHFGNYANSLDEMNENKFYAQCGPEDKRVASRSNLIGRTFPNGCTAFMVGQNTFLTAGHCVSADMRILQFEVPNSLGNGDYVMPLPRAQYHIITSSIVVAQPVATPDDDWAVFAVAKNPYTGWLPSHGTSGGFQTSSALLSKQVRVSGFGVDSTPPQASHTLQTHTGGLFWFPNEPLRLRHQVDTQGGNSGSPIIALDEQGRDTQVVIGIHVQAGCAASGRVANFGVSFKNQKLMNAISSVRGKWR